MTVFKVTKLFILNSKYLSVEISWLCNGFYAPVGVAETPNLNNYKGCPLTFGHVIVVFCTIN